MRYQAGSPTLQLLRGARSLVAQVRGQLARSLALVASVALAVAGCSGENAGTQHPTIVVGVDGADWAVIEELWSQGRLPALRDLADRGARARLGTSWSDSPVIWTTMATGALPAGHGITGFVKRTPRGVVPVTSDLRRVPALWNMLSSLGRRTIVVGWWATWPAEEINGVVVSDRILEPIAHNVSPASLAPQIERGLGEAAAAGSPFDRVESGGERDRAMAWFARRLAAEDFDLLLVYFRTPDIASHYYWRYFEERARDGGEARPCASASTSPTRRSISRSRTSSRRWGDRRT